MAQELVLFELKCSDCKSIVLLEVKKEPNLCPYCEGDLDYAPGKIEPVLTYKPR